MTVTDPSEFTCLKKFPKAHSRGIVGVEVFREIATNDLIVATFAHDSLKFWEISAFDDEVTLDERTEIKKWLCGLQSYDIAERGKIIGVVGVESTLHQIMLDEHQNYVIQDVYLGYMQAWFVRISPDRSSFLTVNFAGSIQLVNLDGQVILSAPFENAKQISSLVYSNSGKYVAFGTTLGWVSVLNSETLGSIYAFEGHAMKIRTLAFTTDDKYLLSGSDDKTIKLLDFAVPIGSKEACVRMFCGHRGAILHIRMDPSSKGQRFASSATDMRVILWDLDSGNQLHVFSNCFEDVVTSLAFALGRFLISATDSGTIIVNRVPLPDNYEEEIIEEIPAKTQEFVEEPTYSPSNGVLASLENQEEPELMSTDEAGQVNGHEEDLIEHIFENQENIYGRATTPENVDNEEEYNPEAYTLNNEENHTEYLANQEYRPETPLIGDDIASQEPHEAEPEILTEIEQPIGEAPQSPKDEPAPESPKEEVRESDGEDDRHEIEMQLGID